MPAPAPVLSLPGTELAAFGKPLAFTFSATDPGGLPLNLSAANLPPGATFNPATGGFLWTPQAPTGLIYQVGKLYPLERREVTFKATDSAQMSANGSVVIEADPGNPVITDLRNAGSQAPQAVPPKVTIPTQPTTMSCAPGSVASLVGRWLASGTQPASDPTGSSTQLAGTEVMVNGNLAPVVYASATRLDFLCPDSVSGGELEISAQIDGTVSNAIPGMGFAVYTSTAANHTYQMEADALTEVGHQGFIVDAQAMAALLYDFATNAEYRAAVKREFTGIRVLFGEYQQALQKVYPVPAVPDPR
jgi:hypothetical protein